MLSQQYRLRDVPKGKRLQHFFHYYKLHVFFAICAVLAVGIILSAALKPPRDVEVLWLYDSFSARLETEVYRNIHSLEWDSSGDGKSTPSFNQLEFDTEYLDLSNDTKSIILTLLSSETYSFLLVSSYAYDWMEETDQLGTWESLGVTGEMAGEKVKIPASDVKFLATTYADEFQETYLVIEKDPVSDEEAHQKYLTHMEILRSYLEKDGLVPGEN